MREANATQTNDVCYRSVLIYHGIIESSSSPHMCCRSSLLPIHEHTEHRSSETNPKERFNE
jgi:hypothetical protein